MQQRISKAAKVAAVLLLALFYPSEARADAGVPMLFVVAPILGLAFFPIVFLEGEVLVSLLPLDRKGAYFLSLAANTFSTCVGVPLTWAALVGLQLISYGGATSAMASALQKIAAVTWHGAWLGPQADRIPWMVPSACLFLIVPFFLVSIWSERTMCALLLTHLHRHDVRRAVLRANVVTYGLLGIANLLWLASSLHSAG